MRKRFKYCAMERKENKTFAICLACNIELCLVKERNCLQKASNLGAHIIYTLYIFTVVFYLVFIYFQSLFEFYIYIIFYIYVVIFSILCFKRPKVVKEM